MRNLHQYPITTDEVLEQLENYRLQSELSGAIGGTHGIVCHLLTQYLEEQRDNFNEFLKCQSI